MSKQVSVHEAAGWLQGSADALFLDVREDSELAICQLPGALHIPMGEVPARADSLPKDQTLVVFCHHGMRSLNVVQYLEARGFENAVNLAGGIHAWAIEIDSEMERY